MGRRLLGSGLGLASMLAAAALLVPALGAQAAGGQVVFPSQCQGGKVKPKLVVLGCGDFNFYINHLRWKHWGSVRATGRGIAHVNNCKPSCEAGSFHEYRGKLQLRKIKLCSSDGKRHYTQARFSFRGDRPRGARHSFKQHFGCHPII